jgi:hypothetical protein
MRTTSAIRFMCLKNDIDILNYLDGCELPEKSPFAFNFYLPNKVCYSFFEQEHLSSHTVTKSIISDNLCSSIEMVKLSVSNKIPIKTILVLGGVAFSIDSSIPQHFSKSPQTNLFRPW